jgi:GH24 family phage-related lysozyme (muramidase)
MFAISKQGAQMIFAVLRKGDGISRDRLFLTSVVKNLQTGLQAAGHGISPDGQFGTNTENAVEAFQGAEHVEANGIVSKTTWTPLSPHLKTTVGANQIKVRQFLRSFEGDLGWVHEREGHRGAPYWPGGLSGVTLDPGVDLGQLSWDAIRPFYESLLTEEQQRAVRTVIGLKGEGAKQALDANPTLRAIRLSRDEADRIMPLASQKYWDGIVNRFPMLGSANALPSVQTVLLSLSYNRGVGNRDLDQLQDPLGNNNWNEVASRIGAMQQNHELEGIRIRRRMEADLIQAEVDYVNS